MDFLTHNRLPDSQSTTGWEGQSPHFLWPCDQKSRRWGNPQLPVYIALSNTLFDFSSNCSAWRWILSSEQVYRIFISPLCSNGLGFHRSNFGLPPIPPAARQSMKPTSPLADKNPGIFMSMDFWKWYWLKWCRAFNSMHSVKDSAREVGMMTTSKWGHWYCQREGLLLSISYTRAPLNINQ